MRACRESLKYSIGVAVRHRTPVGRAQKRIDDGGGDFYRGRALEGGWLSVVVVIVVVVVVLWSRFGENQCIAMDGRGRIATSI